MERVSDDYFPPSTAASTPPTKPNATRAGRTAGGLPCLGWAGASAAAAAADRVLLDALRHAALAFATVASRHANASAAVLPADGPLCSSRPDAASADQGSMSAWLARCVGVVVTPDWFVARAAEDKAVGPESATAGNTSSEFPFCGPFALAERLCGYATEAVGAEDHAAATEIPLVFAGTAAEMPLFAFCWLAAAVVCLATVFVYRRYAKYFAVCDSFALRPSVFLPNLTGPASGGTGGVGSSSSSVPHASHSSVQRLQRSFTSQLSLESSPAT